MNTISLNITYVLLCFSLITTSALSAQVQLGLDIDGASTSDESGSSVYMSGDGNRVAVGSPPNSDNATNAGQVKVYEYNAMGNWVQVGSDINGDAMSDRLGISVSLSHNGNVLAVGAPLNDANGSSSGLVKVFELVGGNWVQSGADIIGESTGDYSGWSLVLSDDGSTLAVGAIYNNGSAYQSGHTRVYRKVGNNWSQIGADINGEANGDESGGAVALSDNGNIVAIGAIRNSGGGYNSGHVRVYQYMGGSWNQLGSDINGESSYSRSGNSVSLSNDGTYVAIGAYANNNPNFATTGHTRVYQFNGGSWVQLGSDIDGENGGDRAGWSVSLSGNGERVAIGSFLNDGVNGINSGNTRIYDYTSGNWNQVFIDIDGEAAYDQSGVSVSLSDDGTRVAIGANLNDDNGQSSGHVRVYELSNCTNTSSIDNIVACENYTWMDGNVYSSSNNSASFTVPNSMGCDSIITLDLTINTPSISSLTETSCEDFTLNGQLYNSTGIYTQTLANSLGCDSTITLNLTINTPSTSSLTETSCEEFTLNGQLYNSTGIYTQTLTNSLGCDSVITLDLTINTPSTSSLIETACEDFTLNGQLYNSTGIYTETLTNSLGCDSVITLDLTINTLEVNATLNNDVLSADIVGASNYQWIDCSNNQEITGANQQTYSPLQSGNYAVEIMQDGCVATSSCIEVILSSVTNNFPSEFTIFPNPTKDKVHIDLGRNYADISFEVFNLNGQLLKTEQVSSTQFLMVDLEQFVIGSYYLKLKSEEYSAAVILIKK